MIPKQFSRCAAGSLLFARLAVAVLCPLAWGGVLGGQTTGSDGRRGESAEAITIDTASVGKPPAELEAVLSRGNVQFLTGGSPPARPDTMPSTGRVAGETRYHFRYRYDGRISWSVDHRSRPAEVIIRVRYRTLDLQRRHEIWLRDFSDDPSFWQDPVLRHELDHVRISSDPRIRSYFLDQVRRRGPLRVGIHSVADSSGRVDPKLVRAQVDEHIERALENTRDYVAIRYHELDRLTRHGLQPIPEDRGLLEFISPEDASSGVPEKRASGAPEGRAAPE